MRFTRGMTREEIIADEFLYVPDLGPVAADLLARDDVYGEAYNLAGPGAISTRELADAIFKAAGHPLKFRAAGKIMVRILGLFIPFMRDFYPMLYLQQSPILLDDSKLQSKLGPIKKTPYEEGIRRTIDGMKARSAA
jgi:nucleoside-diphosphate-sugar epimerase